MTPLALRVEQEMPGLRVAPGGRPRWRRVHGSRHQTGREQIRTACCRCSAQRRFQGHVADRASRARWRTAPRVEPGWSNHHKGRSPRVRLREQRNAGIGYRVRREVDVRPGQITAVSVTIPNGRLNINATPWASVWIDGSPYGETPLGNLSIAPGEHEIVFRHPQLGERRERTLVRPDTAARVAVNLQR